MKTINKTLIAALAGIAMFAFTSPVLAQYKPTGDDGITASPKVRALLDERKARLNTAVATVASMPCPKCKDVWVTQVDSFAKPAKVMTSQFKPTVSTVKHLCDSCDTTITTVGSGKQAKNVATHKCTSCGAESLACCNTKKGSDVATKGMEKKFEIAPLK